MVDRADSANEPLFYSRETKRISGIDWLKKIISSTKDTKYIWSIVDFEDFDGTTVCLEGCSLSGEERIRVCLPWSRGSVLDSRLDPMKGQTDFLKILLLKDFNVVYSYYPLTENEKRLGEDFIRPLVRDIRKKLNIPNLF